MSPETDGGDLAERMRRRFPDTWETVLALLEIGSAGSIEDTVRCATAHPGADLSREGTSAATADMMRGFDVSDGEELLAFEYLPDGKEIFHSFSLLVSAEDGRVLGLVPSGGKGFQGILDSLKGFGGTLFAGKGSYSDENRSLLSRWKGMYMITEPEFPESARMTVRNMSVLRHGDRELRTCKARYDRLTLFRFEDPGEKNRIAASLLDLPKREREPLVRSAGITDVLSNRDGDIREVGRYLDLRESADRMVSRLLVLLDIMHR